MNPFPIHFVDPTIPGLSGRDLATRPNQAIQVSDPRTSTFASTARRFRVVRKALDDLDTRLLRDLGLDRGAS